MNPKCSKCGKEVMDQGVQVDGGVWHQECFVCAGCQSEIGASEFALVNNAPYHPQCAAKAKGQVCGECKQPITGPYVGIDGVKFHKTCLRCNKCKVDVSGGYCELNGKRYCQKCADALTPVTQEYTTRAEVCRHHHHHHHTAGTQGRFFYRSAHRTKEISVINHIEYN